jgi:hypothetical protein
MARPPSRCSPPTRPCNGRARTTPRTNDAELADFFRQAQGQDRERAERAKKLLHDRIGSCVCVSRRAVRFQFDENADPAGRVTTSH